MREDTTPYELGGEGQLLAGLMLRDFDDWLLRNATWEQLTRSLIAEGLAPNSHADNDQEGGGRGAVAVRSGAVSRALHDTRLQLLEGGTPRRLRSRPGADDPAGQRAGIGALGGSRAVGAVSVGLGGQDAPLERTVAIRWAPRRAARLLLIGLLAGAGAAGRTGGGAQLAH